MKEIKTAKRIPFLLNITYSVKKETIEQKFSFVVESRKHLQYAYDQRYCLKRKIEKAVSGNLLSAESFLARIENEGSIVLLYRNDFGLEKKPQIVNCEFYLPPYKGCLYCEKCENRGDFLYCTEKKKHYDLAGIKSCQVFSSIEDIS